MMIAGTAWTAARESPRMLSPTVVRVKASGGEVVGQFDPGSFSVRYRSVPLRVGPFPVTSETT